MSNEVVVPERPVEGGRRWITPKITNKSTMNAAEYGGSPIAIDHFPAADPLGVQAS